MASLGKSIHGIEEVHLPLHIQIKKVISLLFSLLAISFTQVAGRADGGTTRVTVKTLVLLSKETKTEGESTGHEGLKPTFSWHHLLLIQFLLDQ